MSPDAATPLALTPVPYSVPDDLPAALITLIAAGQRVTALSVALGLQHTQAAPPDRAALQAAWVAARQVRRGLAQEEPLLAHRARGYWAQWEASVAATGLPSSCLATWPDLAPFLGEAIATRVDAPDAPTAPRSARARPGAGR